jgi:Tfp pilus assembly protein PilV
VTTSATRLDTINEVISSERVMSCGVSADREHSMKVPSRIGHKTQLSGAPAHTHDDRHATAQRGDRNRMREDTPGVEVRRSDTRGEVLHARLHSHSRASARGGYRAVVSRSVRAVVSRSAM